MRVTASVLGRITKTSGRASHTNPPYRTQSAPSSHQHPPLSLFVPHLMSPARSTRGSTHLTRSTRGLTHASRSTRSTRLTQRLSQRTRKQAATLVKDDFYECPRCWKLLTRYHGSHRRHIPSCEAKYAALAQEKARLLAEQVETPTPEPYTPVLTDMEMDTRDEAEPGAQNLQRDNNPF